MAKDNKDKIKLIGAVALFAAAGGIYFLMSERSTDRPKGTVMQVFSGSGSTTPAAPGATMSSTEEEPPVEEDPMLTNPSQGSHMGNPEFVFPEDPESPPSEPPAEPPPGR